MGQAEALPCLPKGPCCAPTVASLCVFLHVYEFATAGCKSGAPDSGRHEVSLGLLVHDMHAIERTHTWLASHSRCDSGATLQPQVRPTRKPSDPMESGWMPHMHGPLNAHTVGYTPTRIDSVCHCHYSARHSCHRLMALCHLSPLTLAPTCGCEASGHSAEVLGCGAQQSSASRMHRPMLRRHQPHNYRDDWYFQCVVKVEGVPTPPGDISVGALRSPP